MAGRLIDNFSMRRPRALADLGTGRSRFLRSWGLQPRIAPVCTGAGTGSSSTRFRRRFRRFPRRSGIFCRDRSGSTGFRALVQSPSQVQRVPEKVAEKVPEKVLGIFGAGPDQFNRVSEKVSEKVWEALVQSQGHVQQGSGEGSSLVQGQVRFQQVQRVSSAWFRSMLQKRFVKIKRCGCWGYHRSLFS